MQHEHYTHTAPELVFCIRFQNHRHAQPVALGKDNIQHLSHIALPLIFLPHTDKPNENVGLPFLVHAVLQGSPSPLDSDAKLQKALHVRYCFCGIPICRPLLSDLHTEIAAIISAPQRHASLPDQLRMQPGIADVIAVAKAAAQLRAAVFCAGVVIGTLHHIHTPDAVTGLQFFWGKARRRAENAPGGFDENAGNKAVKPRYVQQGGKLFVARSRQVLHIAVNGLQCLLFRHDPLQGLVGRNARQYLPLEVVLLFLACICIFSQQRTQAHIESGVQFLCPRGKALCRSLPEITGKIGFLPLHRPLPFLFVSAVAVGPAGGKGVLPHKICHAARFAHGVVQTAQSRGQVVQP